jgi:hypothetical protein
MTLEELKREAAALAAELGSADRIPEPLRKVFIAVRAELFQRGIYDPVLVRFDSATAPRATTREIAEELAKIAESLR